MMHKARNVFVLLAVLAGLAGSFFGIRTVLAHTGHTVSVADATITEGSAATGVDPNTDTQNVSVTISLNTPPGLGETITIPYATNSAITPPAEGDPAAPLTYGGGCNPGCDYLETQNTISFGPTDPITTSKTVSIPILRDRSDEENEKFNFVLGTPTTSCNDPCTSSSASLADGSAVVTITDDDGTPNIEVRDAAASESGGTLTVTFRRNAASERNTTVNFATANDTATAPADYTAKSGTIEFPNNNSAVTDVTTAITLNNDALAEGPERFLVNISNAVNALISDSQGVQTITDDEAPVVNVSNAVADEGGNLTFQISLTTPVDAVGKTATVNYTTVDGTATDGNPGTEQNDYTAQSGSVTFQPFQTTPHTVTVPTIEDTVDEPNETMTLRISKPGGCCTYDYQITDSDGTGTINDDDGTPRLKHDFNGDGFEDAVFGVPGEDQGGRSNTGAVNVIYGDSVRGLAATTPGDQVWHLAAGGVEGDPANNDRFGSSFAAGHFNSDAFADLAIGIPGRAGSAGAVTVLYGSATGLQSANDVLLTQPNAGGETPEAGDSFGFSLATGDFDLDGHDDLAVGVPGENLTTFADAGAVNVLFGSATGIVTTNNQLFTQETTGISDTTEASDRFGFSVAAGDLNGDGEADLAVGVPNEDLALTPSGTANDAGAVHAIYGSPTGLSGNGSQFFSQEEPLVEEAAENGDVFGWNLAIGDFDGDLFDDLAVGVPLEDVGSVANAGLANVIYGSNSGLAAGADDQVFSQDGAVEGAVEATDLFGASLAAADFNGDGRDDLALGAPYEDIGSRDNGGSVNVLYGAATTGLGTAGNQLWHQNSVGIGGAAEANDLFSSSLAAADYDHDGKYDLNVGVRAEDLRSTKKNAGAANVIYGATGALSASGSQVWSQDTRDVGGGAERGDGFGTAVL